MLLSAADECNDNTSDVSLYLLTPLCCSRVISFSLVFTAIKWKRPIREMLFLLHQIKEKKRKQNAMNYLIIALSYII